MELIEREETIKALVNEAKIIDGKRFEEPNLQHVFDFGGIIRSMPTVQAVPIEVLDKIRAEIEELADADGYGDYQLGFSFGLMMAMEIIDKHKEESEEV